MLFGLSAASYSGDDGPVDYIPQYCGGSSVTLSSIELGLCKQYPELYQYLFAGAYGQFKYHCQQQFKHERWNCTNIRLPLVGATQPFLTLGEPYVNSI